MTSEVTYLGTLRTQATHLRSGDTIQTDAPIDNQGRGEAFSPTDLAATSLASCVLTIMGIKARDKGLNIEGAKAAVTKIMASNPRRIQAIHIHITVPDRSFSDREKRLLEGAAHGCPVRQSLHPDIEERLSFNWHG